MMIEELKEQLALAGKELDDAKRLYRKAEDDLAQAIAESIGLRVGSIVVETKNVGYGSSRREQKRRYEVTKFNYRSYGNIRLSVYGRSLRSDGKRGDVHEIYGAWEVEPCATS